jgi:hypothetical protein
MLAFARVIEETVIESIVNNLINFTVDDGTHPDDTVYARAFPKPGMEKWFLPSSVVSKTFQIIGKTNPAPDANGNF